MDYEIPQGQFAQVAYVLEQLVNYFAAVDQAKCALEGRPVEYSSLTEAVFNIKDDWQSIDPNEYEKIVQDID